MKIYIPHTDYLIRDKRELFILSRLFYHENEWRNDFIFEDNGYADYERINDIAETDIVLFPFSVNYYVAQGKIKDLEIINQECQKFSKRAFAYIEGDFGIAYPEFSNVIYFRMSGFKSQLTRQNKGFPVPLSDHFQRIFHKETISPITKYDLPIIGFCGHATTAIPKKIKELAKCLRENTRRFIQNPFRKDWEPLFASAYERARLLQYFENSSLVNTNFIYRNHYRAGAQTEMERTQTTIEYYNNIANSDYVLCVRGAGNFSVRFYETLMMGKIPIFVNTDCLLPFENKINWKQHVVWVEWRDRKNIVTMVTDFHNQLSNEDFIQMQLNNRKLWKETLSVKGMLEMISNDI